MTPLPPLDPALRLAQLDAVFTALAHPARRQILLTVHFRGGSASAGEIADRFAHSWPTTTRHLQALEKGGLLRHSKRGRQRIYHIDRSRLAFVTEWISWFEIKNRPPHDGAD